MAIKRMTSKQLLDAMDNTEGTINELRSDINTMRAELGRRLNVFSNAMEFAASSISKYSELSLQKTAVSSAVVIPVDLPVSEGIYDKYGITVLPASRSTITNVFNIMSGTGPVFKDNANVAVNSIAQPQYLDMLMHDGVQGKKTTFDEFNYNKFTLSITVNPNDLLGATACNTIELLPYIPGSFDILAIRLFSMQDYRNNGGVQASITMSNTIPNVGMQRIVLDQTIDLYKCEIDINVKFQNAAGKYPFGFRHLYFLNANYDSKSHIMVKMSREKYIDWLSDEISVHDQNGIRSTTCTEEGIKLYAGYLNGVPFSEIEPTSGIVQTTIARNTRDIYINIPLKSGISSIKFKEIGER